MPDPGLDLRDDVVYQHGIFLPKYGYEEADDQPPVVKKEKGIDHNKDEEQQEGRKGNDHISQDGGPAFQQLGGGIVHIGHLLFDADVEFRRYPALQVIDGTHDLLLELGPVIC